MDLTTAEHCRLADAMALLAEGRWSDFEDRLWLGFGDDWTRLLALLQKHGYLSLRGRWKDEPMLTADGAAFLARLNERPQAAAG